MENEESLFTLEGLKVENLKAAEIDKDVLIEIYRDYIKNQEILKQQAEYFANILHLGEEINSVKRRVKDPLHLLTKIVRKRRKAIEDGEEDSPYLDISVDNYKSIVNDLVGIRAIYLFKENWALVNNFILDNFSVCKDEKITINHAIDDDLSFYAESDGMNGEYNYKLEERVSRYRSTHYIISGISPQVFKFELQTRTILDEAWGEIDHHVRYPDFEHNEDLKRKMSILNGAISGCEELTSNFFKDFNELRIKLNNESELLNDKSMSEQSTQEGKDDSHSNVIEAIEDSARVTDEIWDELIESAEETRAKERLLKSKKAINHTMIYERDSKNSKKLLENYLHRMFLDLEVNPYIKKSEYKKPFTSINQYKKIIGDVSKDITIKKDDEEGGED